MKYLYNEIPINLKILFILSMNIIQLLYMDNILTSVNKLNKIYNNLNYWDEYGTSFILFIFLLLILFVVHSYFYSITHVQSIKANWTKDRCSPRVIPFAGLINSPNGKSAMQYTEENFTYCIQNILSDIAGFALQSVTFITNAIQGIFKAMFGDLQKIRTMFNSIRTKLQSISEIIMGKIMNIVIPLQEIIIKARDIFGKTQGILSAGLYTALGAYMTLQTLLGAIIQALVSILVILAGTIAGLLIIAAIPIIGELVMPILALDIGIFIAIAVPTIIIIVFTALYLQLNSESLIPSFCFDKNTFLSMNDGSIKTIEKIQVGDILKNNVVVTAKIVVNQINTPMYQLRNIIVSGSHSVLYNGKWITIDKHPEAIFIHDYIEPYLYCLNTTSKTIVIDNIIFCDWDELFGETLEKLNINKNFIHTFTDGGLKDTTFIRLKNGLKKKISDIKIGDILEYGEKVQGIVEINADDLKQYTYSLGNMRSFEGGYNLYFQLNNSSFSTLDLPEKNKVERKDTDKKLYHLLTNTKTFFVNNIQFYDYNHCIDLYFGK